MMSSQDISKDVLDTLLQKLCDERLAADEKSELLRQLHQSEAVRGRYMEFVSLSVGLADWSQSSSVFGDGDRKTGSPNSKRLVDISANSVNEPMSTARGSRGAVKYWGLALAACVLIAATVVLLSGVNNREKPELAISTKLLKRQSGAAPQPFVARVVEVTSDSNWDVEAMPQEFLMRLRSGEKINLLSGLAMIEFYSGAQLILHGPAKFQLTGRAAGVLYEGRVSGRVDNGDFFLTTPSAEVIDLGTEFGVSVDTDSGTDVLVFDGEVEVRSDSTDPRDMKETVNLTEGMAVRVEEDGQLSGGSLITVDRFSRRFSGLSQPTTEGLELSLVDILCGGSGRGQRLAAAIDPLTGDWDRLGWQSNKSPGTRHSDNTDVHFHLSSWHPLIDSSFIPNAGGKPTQLDSEGHQLVFPWEHGSYTWGPVWARRYSKDLRLISKTKDIDFWGADTFSVITDRLADSRYGGIGVHANVGITFDLQAIRDLNDAEIESFIAVLTNLDNAEAHNPAYARDNVRSADVWIIVDGEIRYKQLGFKRNIAGIPFEVPISPSDKKLTIVTTDAGNSNKYDHIVLIDPVLNLHSEQKASHPQYHGAALVSILP